MKCILNPTSGQALRLPDAEAANRVRYGWRYISKSEYKRAIVEASLTNAKLRRDPKGKEVANGDRR